MKLDTLSMTAMAELPFALTRMLNVPLALCPARGPGSLLALAGSLRSVADVPIIDREADRTPPRGYEVVDGVAVVPITGMLVHRLGIMGSALGMTGCDGIAASVGQALDDPAVRGVLLDIDSPGGEIAGCFSLADAIFAARGRKPIWAVADEIAYSAAYAIASAADRVLVPRSGGVGSIGIIALFADVSRGLEAEGITVNVIAFGARKADGLAGAAAVGEGASEIPSGR